MRTFAGMKQESVEERKAALLSRCRFYKGEEKCPNGVNFFGWECEELYVHCLMSGKYEPLNATVSFFRSVGLDKEPALQDGTPIEVQALLFNRFCYQSEVDPIELAKPFVRRYVKTFAKS